MALTRYTNGTTQVLDYVDYSNVSPNWSYGSVPDGQPFYRDRMFFASPGATNNNAARPIKVFINEWLADNAQTLADPADNDFEDGSSFTTEAPKPRTSAVST